MTITPPIRAAAVADLNPSAFNITLEADAVSDATFIEAAAGADGKPKSKRFSMTAYTGGRLFIANYKHPVVVDLATVTAARKSIPVFLGHDESRIVGHTDAITVDASISVEGVVSGASEAARMVSDSSANGFPWESSIGARPGRLEFVRAGASTQVNGRQFAGPIYVSRNTVLGEVSFVPRGGDEGVATATVAASHASTIGVKTMFETWLEAMGLKLDELSEAQVDKLKAKWKAEVNATAAKTEGKPPADDITAGAKGGEGASLDDHIKARREAEAAEAERCEKIRAFCASSDVREVEITAADGKKQKVNLQAHAIREGWTTDQTELAILRASHQTPAFEPLGDNDGDVSHAGAIEAALLRSVGFDEKALEKDYDKATIDAALSKRYRDYTLHALMDQCIRAAGRHHHGTYKSNDFIRAALEADRELKAASGGFSTLSVSNILENVAHKALINSFESQETVWQFVCAQRSHSNFHVHSRYRLDASGSYQKVGATGELKHAGLTDAKYTNQLDTYGVMMALTRKDMINDDLGAFMQIPTELGRMGAIRREEEFFVTLLGNAGSFFHADNNNLSTGAGSALSITSLTSVVQKFQDQIDPNGKPILVSPVILLVGTALRVTAENLYAEKLIIDGTATALQPARNPHAGLYRPYSSPYLNNTSITDANGDAISGQTATQWYLFANPAVRAAIGMASLNGQLTPTIQSAESDFNTLGMQWRAIDDFGCEFEEPAAAQKSAGA